MSTVGSVAPSVPMRAIYSSVAESQPPSVFDESKSGLNF